MLVRPLASQSFKHAASYKASIKLCMIITLFLVIIMCASFLHSNSDDINGVGVLSVVVIVFDDDEGVTVRKKDSIMMLINFS